MHNYPARSALCETSGKVQPTVVSTLMDIHHSDVASGAPVPRGADAVVQIENTEQLPDRQDGEKRVKIVKVCLQTAGTAEVAVHN